MKTYLISVLAFFFIPIFAFAGDEAPVPVDFGPPEPVIVQTRAGPVSFMVELANTDEERTRGLMYRKALADNAGMLFDFESPRPVSIWMKNTLIPLDIIFIDAKGHVLSIARNARPKSLRPMPSGGPALGVLEIVKGGARKFGIERGDLVRHAVFGTAVIAEEGAEKDLPDEARAPKRAPD